MRWKKIGPLLCTSASLWFFVWGGRTDRRLNITVHHLSADVTQLTQSLCFLQGHGTWMESGGTHLWKASKHTHVTFLRFEVHLLSPQTSISKSFQGQHRSRCVKKNHLCSCFFWFFRLLDLNPAEFTNPLQPSDHDKSSTMPSDAPRCLRGEHSRVVPGVVFRNGTKTPQFGCPMVGLQLLKKLEKKRN